ncbi:MAG: hypothetical protein GY707_01840 [Desulfobacteraceae bacterium]|nr:hypothetical protein [Desulfobacteraceae bacterium]
MGDFKYWTSLWVVGLIIFLFYLISVFGQAVLAFLHDRISVFGIWDSPVWLKIKVPLIVFCVLSMLIAMMAYIRHERSKELQAAREYAQDQGWHFSQNDTQGLKMRVVKILWDLKDLGLHSIRTVETGKSNLYLFDCRYLYQKELGGADFSYGTACLIESDRFHSGSVAVGVSRRDWMEVMQSDKVDMGESLFAQKFLVQSKNPVPAKKIINRSIQAIMLDHLEKPLFNPVSVYIGPGGSVVLTGGTIEHEQLQYLIELARRIEAAVE